MDFILKQVLRFLFHQFLEMGKKIYKILLLAPNIPQLYVAVALIERFQKQLPNSHFYVSTRAKYSNQLDSLKDVEPISIFPELRDRLKDIHIDYMLFIGHAYFLDKALLHWMSTFDGHFFWVNAHFGKNTFKSWESTNAMAALLISTFKIIFYEERPDYIKLMHIGFSSKQLQLVKNVKYECALPSKKQIAEAKYIIDKLDCKEKRLIVVGSIIAGEETAYIIEAFNSLQQEYDDLFLILAPRKMEDVPMIIEKILLKNKAFALVSQPATWKKEASILIVDQTGLLKGFYHWATLAIVGRTLSSKPGGGSNIIEPSAQAIPVIIGPYMSNFKEVLNDFKQVDAIIQLSAPSELLAKLHFLLRYPNKAKSLGEKAAEVVHKHTGALDKTIGLIISRLSQ